MNDFKVLDEDGVFHIWLNGVKHEGTWSELFPFIQRSIEICWECQANFMNLERIVVEINNDFGKHRQVQYICPECRGTDDSRTNDEFS